MLKFLNLRPKRTIRNAFFTAEEAGLVGAMQWVKDNDGNLDSYSAALEVFKLDKIIFVHLCGYCIQS